MDAPFPQCLSISFFSFFSFVSSRFRSYLALLTPRFVYVRMPLSELGLQQAEQAGQKLRAELGDTPFAMWASPYLRTLQTAEGLLSAWPSGQRPEIHEEPELREQEFGNFQDPDTNKNFVSMKKQKQQRYEFGFFYYRFVDGESAADTYSRYDGGITYQRALSCTESS
eukprot:SAG31_NODE_9955_length_1206_cov_0.975610_2_plen_168_part_00